MRIGLFGGTFNPIHTGHLRVAREVQEGFDLAKIVWVPSALPPHKEPQGIAAARDRLEMLRLAVAGIETFEISDVELNRSGPSYTVDTVRQYQTLCPAGDRLFLIMGLDAFLEIDTWKSYLELFERVAIIVVDRPLKLADAPTGRKRPTIGAFLKQKISKDYHYAPARGGYVHPRKQTVFRFQVTTLDISATQIRTLLKANRSIDYLVPDRVLTYIQRQGLYR